MDGRSQALSPLFEQGGPSRIDNVSNRNCEIWKLIVGLYNYTT